MRLLHSVAFVIMKFVRAKFVCSSIETFADGTKKVKMHAVYSGSEENKSFNDYTPYGSFEISISKDKPAQTLFEAGKEYYFDISIAE